MLKSGASLLPTLIVAEVLQESVRSNHEAAPFVLKHGWYLEQKAGTMAIP